MDDRGLKIVMTTDTVGGVWNYSLDLCRALSVYDVEIHLLGLGASPSRQQVHEVKLLDNVSFYPTNLKLEWMDNPWKDILKMQKKLEQLIHVVGPDLLHFNNFVTIGEQFDLPKITVYHSCVNTWWHAVKGESVPPEWNKYLETIESSVNSSDMVVFPSDALRTSAFAVNRITADSMVIPNGNPNEFSSQKKEKIILSTGRIWDEAKNLNVLCAIADKLPWPVYVAGDCAHPDTTEKIALENIRFLGKLDHIELKYWLERTEIYVNPALYEPFGLAVLEAAKSGCALALSNIDSLREIWDDHAHYFHPQDEEALKECLFQLIENDDYRINYQNKAKERAGIYNSKRLGTSYYTLYKALLDKKKHERIHTESTERFTSKKPKKIDKLKL